MKTRTYQIKEVADLASVSTRTLRYYDELGLLTPSSRSAGGYRLYTDADLLRLQQIVIGRSLGLALEDIRKSLDEATDTKALLQQQRNVLVARAAATANMIESIDAALALLEGEQTVKTQTVDMKTLFAGFDPAQYEEEVEQRWGKTDAYRESKRRTREYAEDDWRRVKAESTAIMNDAVALMQTNVAPEDVRAMDIAERYRLWVDRWFYPCQPAMHANLADLYQGDARYAEYFNSVAAGLATFISATIRANAQRPRE